MGIHHLGLATHDMEATLDFYEQVLGMPALVCEMIEPETGGAIRHAFFDAGDGELVAFMECNEVRGVEPDFDTGINRGLGIRGRLGLLWRLGQRRRGRRLGDLRSLGPLDAARQADQQQPRDHNADQHSANDNLRVDALIALTDGKASASRLRFGSSSLTL